jgi:ubiquinone/menaquinone biosynthesis C-methylase UbiE
LSPSFCAEPSNIVDTLLNGFPMVTKKSSFGQPYVITEFKPAIIVTAGKTAKPGIFVKQAPPLKGELSMNAPITDLEALKGRLKATWMTGDFDKIAQTYAPYAAEFVNRQFTEHKIEPGARLLDLACGSGNLSFPAARAVAIVTGVDIAANLLETARARALAEGIKINFDEGDAEALPYQDGSFDVILSMFGAMFAPRPEIVISEMARVCRRGGRVAMANWTPTGFIGQMFKTTAAHVPPPSIPSPLLWGDEKTVTERFSKDFTDLRLTRRTLEFKLPMSPIESVDYFRTWYGPTSRAFAALDENGQRALQRDLELLWLDHNRAKDGSTIVESEYLEVTAVRA